MPDDRYVLWRVLLALAAVISLGVVALSVEGPFVNVGRPAVVLVLAVLWVGPTVAYVLLVRTMIGSVLVGVGLALTLPLMLRTVITTDSSTAGFGFPAVGAVIATVVAIAINVDRMARLHSGSD